MVTTAVAREAIGRTLIELGKSNQNIVVLGGDLNKSTTAMAFSKEFPERFFDFGAAEQNMMSVAAGLAYSGKIPFCTTFAVFGTGRAFDHLRVSISQPRLNVKIVVTHAGLLTGEDGMSAQAIEDLALMMSLPSFTVIVPADAVEAEEAIRSAAFTDGPFYIRLSRPATPVLHGDGYQFKIGQAEMIRDGNDVSILACGVMVSRAMEAAESLLQQGIKARVLNVATLAPIDESAIIKAANDTGCLVTAEEHYVRGGLNSVVSQVIGAANPVPIEAVALAGYAESGKGFELLDKYGLSTTDVVAASLRAIGRKGNRPQ